MSRSILAIVAILWWIPSVAQVDIAQSPYMPGKAERLTTAAYNVFNLNKFLDFKEKDILRYYIDDSLYKQEDLNSYFNYAKDWNEIEQEDTAGYRQSQQKYGSKRYEYTDSTMTAYYAEGGSYNVSRDIKVVLNPQAFVLLREEKISIDNQLIETRSTSNRYDRQNRVISIIDRTEKENSTEKTRLETIIKYHADTIFITTEDGTLRCELSKDPASVGYISKLNPIETYSRFKYSLSGHRYKDACKYLSDAMQANIMSDTAFFDTIDTIKFGSGTSTHGAAHVRYIEDWRVTFTNGTTKNIRAEAEMQQLPQGWKIVEFKTTEM